MFKGKNKKALKFLKNIGFQQNDGFIYLYNPSLYLYLHPVLL